MAAQQLDRALESVSFQDVELAATRLPNCPADPALSRSRQRRCCEPFPTLSPSPGQGTRNAPPVRIGGLERLRLIVEVGRALHGIGLGVTTGSGFLTTGGVPGEPGTSWTGSRSCSFETEIEKTPFEARVYGGSWPSSSSFGT